MGTARSEDRETGSEQRHHRGICSLLTPRSSFLLERGGTPLTFGYDDQHRLTSAYGHSYAYDSAGRMLLFEGGSNFTFDGLHPHAVNRVNGVDRYDYDANGNEREVRIEE